MKDKTDPIAGSGITYFRCEFENNDILEVEEQAGSIWLEIAEDGADAVYGHRASVALSREDAHRLSEILRKYAKMPGVKVGYIV